MSTKTYKSDRDYIVKHIVYHDFGETQMYGTFTTGNGHDFSVMVFKEGRDTKGVIADHIVDMVLSSGAPVRGFYLE